MRSTLPERIRRAGGPAGGPPHPLERGPDHRSVAGSPVPEGQTAARSLCFHAHMPVTVLLADDAASVRTPIKHLLEIEPRIVLVGEVADFSETVVMCAELKPNIVLLDLHMLGDPLEPRYVKSHLLDCARSVLAMSLGDDGESRALAILYGARSVSENSSLHR
jgi:PleD family two-component response regulator